MIIGLIGPKGAGKSTLARQLEKKYGFVTVKFAGILKDMLRTLLSKQGASKDHIERMLEGSEKEIPTPYLGGRSPRHAMATLGTEWGRDLIARNLWVSAWMNQALLYENVICDDVRFLNEAEAIRKLSGKIVLVERFDHFPSDHPSEREYLSITPDLGIWNNENRPRYMLETLEAAEILRGLAETKAGPAGKGED
jgi:hypothetical protein